MKFEITKSRMRFVKRKYPLTELKVLRDETPSITNNNIKLNFKTFLDFKAFDDDIDNDKKTELVIFAK
jgi:hypothetical protein